MTPQQLADAMLASDFEALHDGFAPGVVLHSPITARLVFRGRLHELLTKLAAGIGDG